LDSGSSRATFAPLPPLDYESLLPQPAATTPSASVATPAMLATRGVRNLT